MKGLEPTTSKEVKLRQPDSLVQAIAQASLIHSILFPDGLLTTSSTKNEPTPMDVDTLHVAINNLTAQVNYLSRNNNMGKNNLPPKLTPEEKAYLISKKGCFRCRKIGHMASQCRIFPNQQPRQFNNIETATSSAQQATPQVQSGKANSN
ncbi:hypothetical protein EDD11_000683 [Mortierella claussenii]|nr:hypothetical protein EDD11_000683 [Mortierella claussenii]